VGDYAVRLDDALKAIGIESCMIASNNWSLAGAFAASRSLQRWHFDIVHIQYPTVGFGAKLGPQILALLRRCVITIHEASQRHVLRKLALLPFSIRPKHIIFTTELERKFAAKWAPWISKVSSVIPVGSNINVVPRVDKSREEVIVYFGLIAPRKGIEDVASTVALRRPRAE
jgi:glycosyltransferase involved in cell wall biosynthesis